MFDYFKPQEYFVDSLWFIHEDSTYTGKGILFWNPEDGFHIAANIERNRLELPFRKECRAIVFGRSTSIYLRLSGGGHVILSVYFPDEFGLLSGHLSEKAKRAIFIEQISWPVGKIWSGSALYELSTGILFPDSVSVETKIGDYQPGGSFSRDGIYYKNENGHTVVGCQKEEKYLEINWGLPVDSWTKTECWQYAKGLQFSISTLAGQTLELKYREVYRTNRRYREIFVNPKPVSLGRIFSPYDFNILRKENLVDLCKFFVRGGKMANVAKKIFLQMVDASQQRTDQAQELLLSTILEAALRSLYDCPFNSESNKKSDCFKIDYFLKKFFDEYLLLSQDFSKAWKQARLRVEKAHRRLRHRNAHPDWLTKVEGCYSINELEKVTDEKIFLSRFYGYMIMGLANIQILEPKFPLPVAAWGPIMTMSIGDPQTEEKSDEKKLP